MLSLRGLLVIAACSFTVATPSAPVRAVYDQRQTGDLNVQLELKDLKVIALLNSELLDDYTDYDYFYDYADFTIKPINRPTTSSTTEKNNIMQVSEPQNSTLSASVDNTSPSTSDTTLPKDEQIPNADPNGTVSSTPNADNDKPSEEEDGAGTAPSTTVKFVHALRSQKRCKSGYVPNGDRRCRRVSRPWLTRLLP